MSSLNKLVKEKEFATRLWRNTTKGCVIDLAWSKDGISLAVAAVNSPITIFNSRTANPIIELKEHKFGTVAIAWSADSKCFASSGQDGYIKLWDLILKESRFILPVGERLTWSPLKKFLVSSAKNELCLWDCDGHLLEEYPSHYSNITDIAWRPLSKANPDLMFATSSYGSVQLWSPENTKPLNKFEHKRAILKMAWSPDGKFLATIDQDSRVNLWIVETATNLQMLDYPAKVSELSWDVTSRYLATANGSEIAIWDCSAPKQERNKLITLNLNENLLSQLAYQHKGSLLASAGRNGILAIWQPIHNNQKPLFEKQYPSPIQRLVWSPDDKFLAVGCADGLVEVLLVSI
jgi:WD40 repeat protein